MKKSVIKSAKTVEEAVQAALEELNVTEAEVNIDIIEEPSSGFLGLLGGKPAIVRVVEKEDRGIREEIFASEKPERPKRAPRKTEKPEKTEEKDPDFDVVEFLQKMVDNIADNCTVSIAHEDDEQLDLLISGEELGLIVGKHGETLNALQYLSAMVYNSKKSQYKRVTVDAGDYRKRREEKLVDFALRMAERVKRTGRKYSLEPMNSYERRIVHLALQQVEGINTYSEGREPYRRITITSSERRSPQKRSNNNREKDKDKDRGRRSGGRQQRPSQKAPLDSYREQKAREEQSYKAMDKQQEQLKVVAEMQKMLDTEEEMDNPYEHYYSKYDNRIRKK